MKNQASIIFEDDQLVLINKPAGLLSIPDRFKPERENLQDLLKKRFGRIWTVHRLDRETSGMICFARNPDAHKILSLQFQDQEVEKRYLALVDGVLDPKDGHIEKAIAYAASGGGKMQINAKGKPSFTSYRTLESFKNFTLAEVKIQSGRTHQIRVHFQSIGHPLAVDELYGKRNALFLSEIKGRSYRLGKDQEERPLMRRCSLHAAQLSFQHPKTKEGVDFEAPLPKDFKALINQLRKWGGKMENI